jgi:hypothetical protein
MHLSRRCTSVLTLIEQNVTLWHSATVRCIRADCSVLLDMLTAVFSIKSFTHGSRPGSLWPSISILRMLKISNPSTNCHWFLILLITKLPFSKFYLLLYFWLQRLYNTPRFVCHVMHVTIIDTQNKSTTKVFKRGQFRIVSFFPLLQRITLKTTDIFLIGVQ